MPWSKGNPPGPAKGWPAPAQALCIRVANAALKAGKTDQDAIFACIGAVKKAYPKAIGDKGEKGKKNSAADISAQIYALPKFDLKEGTDGKKVSTLQLLPEGKFQHPWYGELDFTMPILRLAKRNFDSKILGTDIMVDEGHDRGKAMGWFKEVHTGTRKIGDTEVTGLFGNVEWTDLGLQALQSDVYRYFSAEIGSYTDANGVKTPNVLFGGGLTNRPFFKQLPAVKLGEGQGDDRFLVGLFGDPLWTFDDGDEEEEEEDTERTFFSGFTADPEFDEETEEDDPDDDDGEDDQVKYADLIAKLNKDFGLKLSADNEGEAATAIVQAFTGQTSLVGLRKKFEGAGFKFEGDNVDVADVVLAGYNALKTKNDENTTGIAAIRKELDDSKAETAVDKLIDTGKLAPAKRDQYIKLWHTNNELFTDMTKDLEPVVELGEVGGDGVPVEPGKAKADEFKDPAKATEEADRYIKLVPALEERMPAGKK